MFGDSFPAGADLIDRSTAFPNLIAQTLGTAVNNYAQDSTSIDHACLEFFKFLKTDYDGNINYKALFCLTGRSRTIHFTDNSDVKEIHPYGADHHDIDKAYYKYMHSTPLENFNYLKNVLMLDSLCKSRNIKPYFINNWDKKLNDPLLADVNFYNKTLVNIIDPDLRKLKVVDYGRHPTAEQHHLIAERLSEWIS